MDPVVRIMFQQVRERLPFYRLLSSILIYSPFAARVFFIDAAASNGKIRQSSLTRISARRHSVLSAHK